MKTISYILHIGPIVKSVLLYIYYIYIIYIYIYIYIYRERERPIWLIYED